MPLTDNSLPFPLGRPSPYLALIDEPVFDPGKHLALERPDQMATLHELGYSENEVNECASPFAYSSAFRILSEEGAAAMHHVCDQIYDNRNESAGTGANRLGSYARGAGYRSRFIKDFCDSADLSDHLSSIAGVTLRRHSVPAVACGINYAPEDISRAVDTWHVDSVAFDVVMMVTDPKQLKGGEFEIFKGTKTEGRELLGIAGEEGRDAQLPDSRVTSIPFPDAGFGFLQQGTMIFHRACRLLEKAERITMIPSFEIMPSAAEDATNSINMIDWADPGIHPELTRFEIHRTIARLEALLESITLEDDRAALAAAIHRATDRLSAFTTKLEEHS